MRRVVGADAGRHRRDDDCQGPGHRLRAAEDVRQKGQRRAEAVIAGLVDKPAASREKPPQLPARLVKNGRPTTSPEILP